MLVHPGGAVGRRRVPTRVLSRYIGEESSPSISASEKPYD
jgi:hypothetical protein